MNGAIAYAWTGDEKAQCSKHSKLGLNCIPDGRGSKGSLSCRCDYTDPKVMKQDIEESRRQAREQEADRRRRGVPLDESDTRPSKKIPPNGTLP